MAIQIKNITKSFKGEKVANKALENIDLKIASGKITCLLGPSGCGKTTLLRLIGGLDQADSGEILEEGQLINSPSKERGFVFQQYSLFPWLNVLENVMFGLELNGLSKEENLTRAKTYLDSVGLGESKNNYPHELSGGMKQRVAIVRTLVNKTKFLLMDEPFSALDMQNRHKLQKELIHIWKKTKKTIIFVTHDIEEAVFLADEVIIMNKHPGRIKKVLKIGLDHNRNRNSEEFLKIQSKIIDILE